MQRYHLSVSYMITGHGMNDDAPTDGDWGDYQLQLWVVTTRSNHSIIDQGHRVGLSLSFQCMEFFWSVIR